MEFIASLDVHVHDLGGIQCVEYNNVLEQLVKRALTSGEAERMLMGDNATSPTASVQRGWKTPTASHYSRHSSKKTPARRTSDFGVLTPARRTSGFGLPTPTRRTSGFGLPSPTRRGSGFGIPELETAFSGHTDLFSSMRSRAAGGTTTHNYRAVAAAIVLQRMYRRKYRQPQMRERERRKSLGMGPDALRALGSPANLGAWSTPGGRSAGTLSTPGGVGDT